MSNNSGANAAIERIKSEAERLMSRHDAGHDFSHVLRVATLAGRIAKDERADMEIVLPAALLHDIAPQDKSSVDKRKNSADASTEMATHILKNQGFPPEKSEKILYAIRVHSFSKGIVPETLEAKILQDADRLDAIGAIGLARMFAQCGSWKGHRLYCMKEPFARSRALDESKYSLDHYFTKLSNLKMNTQTAEELAAPRREFMRSFIEQLRKEI